MIMLRIPVNYTNDDYLFVWMIDFNPKIFTRRHKNVQVNSDLKIQCRFYEKSHATSAC